MKTLASNDATPDEGDVVTFEITVNNSGPNLATNVSLTDFLPEELTANANNGIVVGGGSYNPTTGVLSIATLASGDTVTLTLEGTVNPGQSGMTITNTTTAATGDQVDPSTVGDDLEEAVNVGVLDANLVTVKTLSSGDATPREGETVTFEIAVNNSGPIEVTNVSLTDFLPSGLTATANNGNVDGAGTYNPLTGVLSIATLASGDIVTLTLEGVVSPGQGGNVITNTTTAAVGDQPDNSTVGDDLEEAVTVEVATADLVTVKTLASSDATPAEGDTITFEITVNNSGPDAATNVSLTDFLPQGLTATANNGNVIGGGSYNPATGVLSIATLASGGTVTLTLEGVVNPGQGGSVISNTTTAATGDQVDPSTVGDDLEEAVTVEVPTADLVTVKSLASGDATPEEGDTVTFEITVNNSGPNSATNVSLTDFLPQGLTATANNGNVIGGGSYNPATGVLSIATLASGDTVTLTLEGIVDPGQGGSVITNTTTAATGDQDDPSTVGDDLEEAVTVGVPAADLVTVKSLASGDATPNEGDTVTFEITVNNSGPDGATNISLTDFLPQGLTATANNGNVIGGGLYNPATGVLSIATLASGDTVTLTLEGVVDPGQGGSVITNTTTAATGDQVDPSTVGDDLEEAVTVGVQTADLVTVKTLASGDATPDEGDTVTFEITVNNSGPNSATNVSLTDFLPQGLTATANNGDVVGGGIYDPATGVLSIATLASGDTVTLTLEGTVDPGQDGTVITNTTTAATGDQFDPSTVGDDLEEAVTVEVPAADLVTVKTLASGDATPNEGDTVTFEITVNNSGPDGATNISLTDFLPQGLTATANNGDVVGGGLYDPATGVLSIATLASGGTVTLTLEGIVDPGQGGSVITNTTTAATGDQVDPSTVGDDLEEAVTVGVQTADLVTVKSLASGDATPNEGDLVTFEITVNNSGPNNATNILLTDFLPQGLTATANNGDVVGGGLYDPATGVLSIATLASGDTVTLTLEGIVDAGQGGSVITNTTTAATGDQGGSVNGRR